MGLMARALLSVVWIGALGSCHGDEGAAALHWNQRLVELDISPGFSTLEEALASMPSGEATTFSSVEVEIDVDGDAIIAGDDIGETETSDEAASYLTGTIDTGRLMIDHDAQDVQTHVSYKSLTCLCADAECTLAIAVNMAGVRQVDKGTRFGYSPLIPLDPNTGQPLPCLTDFTLDWSAVAITGCERSSCESWDCYFTGNHSNVLPHFPLLVENCVDDRIDNLRLIDANSGVELARPLFSFELLTGGNHFDTMEEYFSPDRPVAITFSKSNTDNDPVLARIQLPSQLGPFDTGLPQTVTLPVVGTQLTGLPTQIGPFDLVDTIEQAIFDLNTGLNLTQTTPDELLEDLQETTIDIGRLVTGAVVDSFFKAQLAQEFRDENLPSTTETHNMIRILMAFSAERLLLSTRLPSTIRPKARIFQSSTLHRDLVEGRPETSELPELLSGVVLLCLVAGALGLSLGNVLKLGFSLERLFRLVGSLLAYGAQLASFMIQWQDEREKNTYSKSMLRIEAVGGGYTGGFAPLRVGRQYNPLTVTVYSGVVSDTSSDYTWIFVSGTIFMIVTFVCAVTMSFLRANSEEVSTKEVSTTEMTTTVAQKEPTADKRAADDSSEEGRRQPSVEARYDSNRENGIEVVVGDNKRKKKRKKKRGTPDDVDEPMIYQ